MPPEAKATDEFEIKDSDSPSAQALKNTGRNLSEHIAKREKHAKTRSAGRRVTVPARDRIQQRQDTRKFGLQPCDLDDGAGSVPHGAPVRCPELRFFHSAERSCREPRCSQTQ